MRLRLLRGNKMPRPKISIIGAGGVGATAAHWIASKELADILLVDINEDMAKGKALDLLEAGPVIGFDVDINGTNDFSKIKDSDIVVLTAGMPRKPGMNREDLMQINTKITEEVTEKIAKYAPDSFLIVVTNPVDAMVYLAFKITGFKKNKVIGMAGNLDSTRFRTFIAEELDASVNDVNAIVIGSHSDMMLPLPGHSSVGGILLPELLPKGKIDALVERTKKGGKEVINLLKTLSTSYAPGAGVAEIAEAILKDKKRILSCSAYCDKEYDVNGCFVNVPVVIGNNGIEKIIELKLSSREKKDFEESVGHIRKLIGEAEKCL
jgi:malate dehydrogenase